MPTQKFTQQDVDQLSTWFQRRYESQFAWSHSVSMCMDLSALRGAWSMAGRDSGGDATDYSGLAHHMTLGGNVTYNQSGLATWAVFPGAAGDYFTHLDHADFDITGGEAFEDAPGMSAGGWCYFDNAVGANEYIMSKWAGAGVRSFVVSRNAATGVIDFLVSTDGTNIANTASSTSTPATAAWFHWSVRFVPSAEMSVFINGVETLDVAGIPATIFNSAAALNLGAYSAAAGMMSGRQSLVWICGAALTDSQHTSIFHQTQAVFGI